MLRPSAGFCSKMPSSSSCRLHPHREWKHVAATLFCETVAELRGALTCPHAQVPRYESGVTVRQLNALSRG